MRNTFVKTLTKLASRNKNIYLMTGDLGFSALEPFIQQCPKQFINIGVAEQDLMGASAGMALSGKIVYAYSIVTFVSMRALEQIRNDVCYQNLPVRIIGVGGGFSYGSQGSTHHGIEDIAIMRALPNMTVVWPSDPKEVVGIVKFSEKYKGPMYIRLGKAGEPIIKKNNFRFELGGGYLIRGGSDCVIFSAGPILINALKAADLLKEKKISCRVISMPSIKPIDKSIILKAARETKAIISLEEHNIIGGLGSAISEALAESGFFKKIRFKRLGIPDEFPNVVGSQDYLRDLYGLSPKKIANKIIGLLRNK